MKDSSWLAFASRKPQAKLRLFCFSYAGCGASVFRSWSALLPESVEVAAIQLPGRETRFIEPALHDLNTALTGIVGALVGHLDKPFAFFGHSLGSLVAFETARLLRRRKMPLPRHMFVSGRRAIQVPIGRRPFYDLPNDELLDEIRALNGSSAGVLENEELMALMLPTLRADFAIHDTYRYYEEEPLDIPFSVFGGLDDHTTDMENLTAWQALTTRGAPVSLFPGGHFFIDPSRREVVAKIEQKLSALLETQSTLAVA